MGILDVVTHDRARIILDSLVKPLPGCTPLPSGQFKNVMVMSLGNHICKSF